MRTDTKKTDAKAGPTRLTIHELVDAYRAGDTTPTAATEAYLARIAALDEKVGAFLTVTRDQALAQAHAADERYRKGMPRGPLDGAPFAIKDVFCTRGIRTTCGSKILDGLDRKSTRLNSSHSSPSRMPSSA